MLKYELMFNLVLYVPPPPQKKKENKYVVKLPKRNRREI